MKTYNTIDELWKDVISKLPSNIQANVSVYAGKPYIHIKSKSKHLGVKDFKYCAVYSSRAEEACVNVETLNGGEEGKQKIQQFIDNHEGFNFLKDVTAEQGAKNKSKWFWTLTVPAEELDEELADWYAETIVAFYEFFENPTCGECQEDEDNEENEDYKILRVKISACNFKEIAVQPIFDEEGQTVLSENEDDVETAYDAVATLNEEYGMERLNYYFIPSCSETTINVCEVDEDGEVIEEVYEESEYMTSPNRSIMALSDAISNYEDDEEALEEYKRYLTGKKFEEEHWGCPIVAKSLKKAWMGLNEDLVGEGSFLPAAMAEAMSLSDAETAVIRGVEMTEEFDISFYIRVPRDEEFDTSKLDFIGMDVEYEDNSSVLQEHLACDMVCLNILVYDDTMYFSGDSNTLVDGGYTDTCDEAYDYVDNYIESLL